MTGQSGRPLTREEAKAAVDALRTLGRALIRIHNILDVASDAIRLGPGPPPPGAEPTPARRSRDPLDRRRTRQRRGGAGT